MPSSPTGGGANEKSEAPKIRYYTPEDVALHNCAEDCWLSLFGQVRSILLWDVFSLLQVDEYKRKSDLAFVGSFYRTLIRSVFFGGANVEAPNFDLYLTA